MKKPQSERAQKIRAAKENSEETCPEHGHKIHKNTKYGQEIKYLCGCPTGITRQ